MVADAVADGLLSRSGGAVQTGTEAEVEPMPDWERELLGAQEAAEPARPTASPTADDRRCADSRRGGGGVAAAAAEPVPADEVPAVVAAEADAEPLPTTREERAAGAGRVRRELTPADD